jgi:hypothetical protein
MKKLVALAVATAFISGCSTSGLNPFNKGESRTVVSQPSENTTAVKDQTVGLVNEEGVKIYYTMLGDLDRIEVYGVAPAWKGNVEIVAEADAKERLVKFLYDSQVDTRRNVEIITRTLDKARDNSLNMMEGNEQLFQQETIAEEVDRQMDTAKTNPEDNTSRRIAQRVEQTKITALTKITSGGALRGVRKIGSEIRNDGKTYVAIYQWSEKDQKTAVEIRNKMFGK